MKKIIFTFAFSIMMFANFCAQQEAVKQPSAQNIIDRYIRVLGGKEKLQSVKTLSMKNTISVMGMEMEGKTVKKDNKFKSTQTMMGQEMSQVFDGEKGFANQMGQKMDFPADQVSKLKTAKLIDALGLDAAKIKSVEKTAMDGKDYYVLSSDEGKSYFDAETGLLYKTENEKGSMIIKKYADVDGIKFVEEMSLDAGGQQIEIKNTDIKINQPVSDDEFK